MPRVQTKTGGRKATAGVIPGDFALSVGLPDRIAPPGWQWTKLTDVARLETGHTPSRKHPEYWGGNVPWIGIRDSTANHGRTLYETNQYTNDVGISNSSARILPSNTVCLSRTASVGYVVVMGCPMATSQDFVNWVCNPEKLDYQFLKYILLSENRNFLRFASGTTHQTIYFPEVKAFHVCLPSVAEQQAISHVLGTLDEKIELNRQMNATLEAMAQALFKSWFVDFDPVIDNALAAGNPIPEPLQARAETRKALGDQRKPLPEGVREQFPDRFVFDEEMGWVPEGWEVGVFGDVARHIRQNVSAEDVGDFDLYVGLEHIGRKQLFLSADSSGRSIGSNKSKFSQNDILFGKLRPYFHKVCIAPKEGICSTDIIVFRPKQPLQHSFVTMTAYSEKLVEYASLRSTGTRMPRANAKDLLRYPIVFPHSNVLESFEALVSQMWSRGAQSVTESHLLGVLRDTLLPKLLSGQLRIPDAEKQVAEAM